MPRFLFLFRTCFSALALLLGEACVFARNLASQDAVPGTDRVPPPLVRGLSRKEALEALPLGAVRPLGWLRQQLQENLAGFTGHLDALVPALILEDDIYGRNRLSPSIKNKELGAEGVPLEDRAQFLWWNSETQSNWWDGFVRTAALLGDPQGLARAEAQVRRLLATQDADGYLGIYAPSLRYRFHGENGELWSKATALRYLLGWYEYSGDESVKQAVIRAIADLMTHYPAWRSQPFASSRPLTSGLTHGLAITDILEALHRMTGDPSYQDYLLFCYWDFSEQRLDEDGQLGRLRAPDLPLHGHGVHTYEQLRSVAAARQAAGGPELDQALESFLRKIERCTNASGGPLGDEFIAGGAANATERGYEYCSLQELQHSYLSLLQKTGVSGFGDRVERLFFNAAQGARHPGGRAIAYLKSDNSYAMTGPLNQDTKTPAQTRYKYSPVHQDAAVCCVPNAGRIGPYFVQAMWSREGETLVANLFGPCELRTEVKGLPVRILQTADYPWDTSLRFAISAPGLPLALKLRRPSWAETLTASRPYREENGYLYFSLPPSAAEQVLELNFHPRLLRHRDPQGELYFSHGALVLCHPIAARETVSRQHPLPGFVDLKLVPENPLTSYSVTPEAPCRLTCSQPLRYEALLTNTNTRQSAWVALEAIAGTTLRQTTFPEEQTRTGSN